MAPSSPFTEFLDDYFAECDEHLAGLRRCLLVLSRAVDAGESGRLVADALEESRRRLHTLKGLSAMVGLGAAADLTHALESCVLWHLRRGDAPDTTALSLLSDGLEQLEGILAARKDGRPIPNPEALIRRAEAFFPSRPSAPAPPAPHGQSFAGRLHELTAAERELLLEAQRSNIPLWRVTFEPTQERNARGLHVNAVRERLASVGSLVKALPRILPEGGIVFDFYVAAQHDPSTWGDWMGDGLSWERCADPSFLLGAKPTPFENVPPWEAPGRLRSQVIRVDAARLDDIHRSLGDLFATGHRLKSEAARLASLCPAPALRPLEEGLNGLFRQLKALRSGIVGLRMMPMEEVFDRLQLAAVNLARDLQKQVTLELKGAETEIDKFMAERLLDPLLHVVRNAVFHGLESRDERTRAGKDPVGRLCLEAASVGDRIRITVQDDGRGIDEESVRRRARQGDTDLKREEAEGLSLLDILCRPGFSTKPAADHAAGRGVGLSILRETVESLGGRLDLHTKPGEGTTFVLDLPATLVVRPLIVVEAAGLVLGIPLGEVARILRAEAGALSHTPGGVVLPYEKKALPLLDLGSWAGRTPVLQSPSFHVLVIGQEKHRRGLAVHRIRGLFETVVQGLDDPLLHSRAVAGATDLGDGQVVLVLHPADLEETAPAPIAGFEQRLRDREAFGEAPKEG